MTYPLVQAKHYTPGLNKREPIRLIVLHSAENNELPDAAHNLALWFAGPTAPQASAHYMVDYNTVVQSVKNEDIAWHCDIWDRNVESIGIELTGRAAQTPAQWADSYSEGVLRQATSLCKGLMGQYGIPATHLTYEQILDGKTKGFCTHADITYAHKIAGGHTDPGVNFPMVNFLKGLTA